MSSHRVFAQLAFERALGQVTINALNAAVQELDQFEGETTWPNDQRAGMSGYDIAEMTIELKQIIEDRVRDVLQGPGLGIIQRGELFHQPKLVEMIETARDRERGAPG